MSVAMVDCALKVSNFMSGVNKCERSFVICCGIIIIMLLSDCPGYIVGDVIDAGKVQELSGCTRITPGGITIGTVAGSFE